MCMQSIIKKTLLPFFVTAFVVAAPVVLLYASGYQLNFKTARFERTGLLVVATQPKGATITLDDEQLASTTPARIQRLQAGTYTLTVTKKNTHPWVQRVVITAGTTTLLKDIVLFHSTTENERITTKAPHSLLLDQKNRQAAFSTTNATLSTLYYFSDTTAAPVALTTTANATRAFSLSPTKTHLIAFEEGTPNLRLFTTSSQNEGQELRVPIAQKKAQWTADGRVVYFHENDRVTKYLLGTNDYLEIIPSDVHDMYLQGSVLYVITQDKDANFYLEKRTKDFQTIESTTPLGAGDWSFGESTPASITLLDRSNEVVTVLNAQTMLTTFTSPHATFTLWAKNAASIAGKNMLYGDMYELLICCDEATPNATIATTLARYASPIHNVVWHESNMAALFLRENAIYAVATRAQTTSQITELARFDYAPTAFFSSSSGEYVYVFIEKGEQAGIHKLRIFDKDTLLP